MTTFHQPSIDFAAIDTEYRARVDLTGNDWRADEDFALFVDACRRVAVFGVVSQNDLRIELLEETVDGPRCSIQHNRYSAFFSRAIAAGLLAKAKRDDGRTLKDVCTTSPTGNNGKEQVVYELPSP